MFKRLLCIAGLCCLFALPVYAHLTGAFADFLAIVYDESTIEKLQLDMQQTKEEIEELTPKVAAAEVAFTTDQQIAIGQLQFYSEIGLDTWFALMQQGSDVIDLLGSQWVMQSKIENYLVELNDLYLQYKQLLINQQTLQGHSQLLQAIEKNLGAREDYLEETAGLELEIIANYLDIDWTAEVEDHIIADLQKDADIVTTHLLDWVKESPTLPYELNEAWLNDQSNLHYYFRNDHVYVEYELEYAHVLILGQVLQNEAGDAAELIFEAGFYNGFFLPEELLVELAGFKIEYETVKTLDGIQNPYLKQSNGSLLLHTK